MNGDKQSFWKTIPGILSGIALVITAFTGFYIAFNKVASSANKQDSIPIPIPEPIPQGKEYLNWPIYLEETFSEVSVNWPEVKFKLDESGYLNSYEIKTVNGKYRFDISFKEEYGYYWHSIETDGKVIDFYAAVDFRFKEFVEGNAIYATIIFGRIAKTYYTLNVTASEYVGLKYFNGTKTYTIIGWIKIPDMNPHEFNRMTIAINNQQIDILINDELIVENFSDKEYLGGNLGLRVEGSGDQEVIVDFDNFELRLKPD